MKNLPTTKKGKILAYLQSGRTLSGKQAWALFGVYRLSSCINRLRNEFGHDAIKTIDVKTIHGEIYGEYKWML